VVLSDQKGGPRMAAASSEQAGVVELFARAAGAAGFQAAHAVRRDCAAP
jgi:hypothetical protein